MIRPKQLTLDELVDGLEHFGPRYDALDVFTRDLQAINSNEPTTVFERNGKTYMLRVHPSGFARLTRAKPGLTENQKVMGLFGPALGATVLDRSLPSALIGFLVGTALGQTADSPKRVFTMSYDPVTKAWDAYDGPLSKLVREKRREAEAALETAG